MYKIPRHHRPLSPVAPPVYYETGKHSVTEPLVTDARTFRLLSSAAYFSAFFTMFSISSLLRPPDDWITTEAATQQKLGNEPNVSQSTQHSREWLANEEHQG